MNWLFEKESGLSVYGASILLGVLVIVAAIIGFTGEAMSGIDPTMNHDYNYSKAISDFGAIPGMLDDYLCVECHKATGKEVLLSTENGYAKLAMVAEKNICPGYKFDSKRCLMCHSDFMKEDDEEQWNEVVDDPKAHPEIKAFDSDIIPEGDLEPLITASKFKFKWSIAQWFSLIFTILSIIGLVVYLAWIIFREKDERWLTG